VNSSPPFTVNLKPSAPSFLRFSGTNYVVAEHANFTLLGPASLGTAFNPAQPGETILLYAVGFGLPNTPVTNGSSTQAGILPALPDVKIGGVHADVYAAIIIPGLAQLNVTVPTSAQNGDNEITVTYGGSTTPAGVFIPVQAP
jgi:uncharacterized protein (TIGR03437 family)